MTRTREENTTDLAYEAKTTARNRIALLAAIARARREPDTSSGLLAQRRILADGRIEWCVAFDNTTGRCMTVITDEDVRTQSDPAIADLVQGCWDADWDDLQRDDAVGALRDGRGKRGDFKPRVRNPWRAE